MRWLVPVAAIAGTTLVASLPHVLPVGADPVPVLPTLTPGQLLSKVKNANVTTLTGDIRLSTNLGLPDLSSLGGGGGSATFLDLLSGTHVAHLWIDGTEHARLALDSPGAENDWIRNGTDLWSWDSATQAVQHATLSETALSGSPDPGKGGAVAGVGSMDPVAAADALVAAIDPTTSVTVTTPGYVAGRPVYELVVSPKSVDSTIADGVISIDAATGIPLGVRVEAKGASSPAISIAFTDVSFDKPAASTFDFTVPPGAHLTEVTNASQLLPLGSFHTRGPRGNRAPFVPATTAATPSDGTSGMSASVSVDDNGIPAAGGGNPPSVKTIGNDWTSMAIISNLRLGRQFQQLFSNSPSITVGSTTGHLMSTSLINVLILDDGRIVVGAVTPAVLESAAAAA